MPHCCNRSCRSLGVLNLGSASGIHQHVALKGGPPLEFINIQSPQMGITSRIHQHPDTKKGSTSRIHQPKGGPPQNFINHKGIPTKKGFPSRHNFYGPNFFWLFSNLYSNQIWSFWVASGRKIKIWTWGKKFSLVLKREVCGSFWLENTTFSNKLNLPQVQISTFLPEATQNDHFRLLYRFENNQKKNWLCWELLICASFCYCLPIFQI